LPGLMQPACKQAEAQRRAPVSIPPARRFPATGRNLRPWTPRKPRKTGWTARLADPNFIMAAGSGRGFRRRFGYPAPFFRKVARR